MINDNTSNVLLQTVLALTSFHLSKILYINANIDMAVNIPYIFDYEAAIVFQYYITLHVGVIVYR